MSEAEIVAEIETYNQVEGEQLARLRNIFDAIKARRAYRRIDFALGRQWVNCWSYPADRPDLDFTAYIKPLDRTITRFDPGSE